MNRFFYLLGAGVLSLMLTSCDRPSSTTTGERSQMDSKASAKSTETIQTAKMEPKWDWVTDRSHPWQVRVQKLRQLDPQELTEADIDHLISLLDHQPEAAQQEGWWVVMNEIMEQLRIHQIATDQVIPAFTEIVQDANRPVVVRDYAIQHLGQLVAPHRDSPYEQDEQAVRNAVEQFSTIITDPTVQHTSLPGTSLMVLVDAWSNGTDPTIVDQAMVKLEPWMSGVLTGETDTSLATRTTAISVVGLLKKEEYAETIRNLATATDVSASLRLSSIATLGQLALDSDQQLLEQIATSNTKFKFAAQSALKNYLTE